MQFESLVTFKTASLKFHRFISRFFCMIFFGNTKCLFVLAHSFWSWCGKLFVLLLDSPMHSHPVNNHGSKKVGTNCPNRKRLFPLSRERKNKHIYIHLIWFWETVFFYYVASAYSSWNGCTWKMNKFQPETHLLTSCFSCFRKGRTKSFCCSASTHSFCVWWMHMENEADSKLDSQTQLFLCQKGKVILLFSLSPFILCVVDAHGKWISFKFKFSFSLLLLFQKWKDKVFLLCTRSLSPFIL